MLEATDKSFLLLFFKKEVISLPGAWPGEPEERRAGDLALASIDFSVALAELYAGIGLTD